jgi:hypothetical protein
VEEAVERLRKPEDGTSRRVGTPRHVDTIGDAAKREETPGQAAQSMRRRRKEGEETP